MFRTIVVGCDGSASADALVLAQQLRDPEGRLLLAAVHPRYGALPDRSGGFQYARYIAEQCAEDLARAAAGVPDDVPVELRVIADDSVAGAIDGLADREGADLIVLGATRRKAVGRLTGRATVQRLMHGAPCAVAVAAPGQAARFGTHPRLCVAYDGSPDSDAAADAAYAIAAATASSVVLLHAVAPVAYAAGYAAVPVDLQAERTVRERAEAQVAEVADRAPEGVSVEQRAPDGPAARVILDVAQTGFDLLVVGSRHYGPMYRVLVGSVSAPLLTNGRVPVLVTARHGAADTSELDRTVVAVGA